MTSTPYIEARVAGKKIWYSDGGWHAEDKTTEKSVKFLISIWSPSESYFPDIALAELAWLKESWGDLVVVSKYPEVGNEIEGVVY